MNAYPIHTLLNIAIIKKATLWYTHKLIPESHYSKIISHYRTDFYTPNVFVKIGLFIFVVFILLATMGIYSLFFSSFYSSHNNAFFIFTCLLFSIACFVVLELLIKEKKVYRAGADEALLYSGLLFLATAVYLVMDNITSPSVLLYAIAISPFIYVAVLRYADRLITLVFLGCLYIIFFLLVLKLGAFAKVMMPFALMLLSGAIYVQLKKLNRHPDLFYWKWCMVVGEFFTLVLFYVSCNYYVIRESSSLLFNMLLADGQDIPLAWLFYLLTAMVPLLYIYFGLKRKDKTLLWSGLWLLVFAVFTFRYYFDLGHPEVTLTVCGLILMAIAYFAIQYLKTPRHGLTFKEELDEHPTFKSNAEAMIVMEGFAQTTGNPVTSNTIDFGGGASGGGGSEGSY